jgi:hypothetical protein
LNGHPTDPEWTATDKWTVDYLLKRASKVPVRVEHRTAEQGSYGQGDASKLDMKFGDVLKKLSKGDTSLYMTTQPVAPAPDGHPEIMAPPTSYVATDFPIQPEILGNLVPQQVNIWMGCAPKGSSTGLHVDFHDNLYILLYGKKRFRLFPPSALPRLYLHGEATVVYPNGRIVFERQGNVLPDGSEAGEVAAWKKKRDAEVELEAAEAAVARREKGAKARLAAAEAVLDGVLEDALDDDTFGDFDDFEAMEMADRGTAAVEKLLLGHGAGTAGEPDSFSKINFNLPANELRARFPDFPGVEAALEVEIQAGQSLYLPAGWFHEVTSYSGVAAAGGDGEEEEEEEQPAFHLALNYWTHPPDIPDSSEKGFQKPYSSEYWPELWNQRRGRYLGSVKNNPGGGGGGATKNKRNNEADAIPAVDSNGKRKHDLDDDDCSLDGKNYENGVQSGYGYWHEQENEIEWRAPSIDERAHFLQGIRGMFGHGRRQHLYRFIGLRLREGRSSANTNLSDIHDK